MTKVSLKIKQTKKASKMPLCKNNLRFTSTHMDRYGVVIHENLIHFISAYLLGLLQMSSDDLPDRWVPLGWGTGVDCDASLLHPAGVDGPAQLQVRGRCVRVAREVGGAEFLHPCAAFHSILHLELRRIKTVTLSPAG